MRRRLDPATLPFETTAEVPPLRGTIGQHRALDAIDFGLEVGTPGYNLFLAGIGTVIALMIPYTLVLTVAWTLLFIAWYVIGIPVGPGWPIR